MAEEFQESEVVFTHHYFPDYPETFPSPPLQHSLSADDRGDNTRSGNSWRSRSGGVLKEERQSNPSLPLSCSAPVTIPERGFYFRRPEDCLGEEEYERGEIVPPHVITERRIQEKIMAFSVCTGNGRTLKGRDLSRVRNSILRMTGFLEA